MTAKGKQWTAKDLRVEDIRERNSFQLRARGINRPHAQRLLSALTSGQALPPVKVAEVGKAFYLIDGFHRLDAYRAARWQTVPAVVARMGLKEAQEEARLANTTHGLNLTQEDKRQLWEAFVAAKGHLDDQGELKSSRVIAADLNHSYTHTTVRRKLKALGLDLNEGEDFEPRVVEGDSEEYLAWAAVEEANDLMARLAAVLPTLEPDDLQRFLGVARDLLDAVERGEETGEMRAALMDTMDI